MKAEIRVNKKSIVCSSIGFKWSSAHVISNAKHYENEQLIAIIVVLDDGAKRLKGLNLDGSEPFDIDAPEGWSLYSLSSHSKSPVSVVCVPEKEGFYWQYGVHPGSGELTPICRSY